MKYYLNAWKKMFDYRSRSTRKDFWMFYAVDLSISTSLIAISIFLFYVAGAQVIASYFSLAYLAYVLVGIPAQLALWIRRFHDVGRSGWFYFMILIPIIGIAFLAYNAFLESQIGENKYGPNPYGIGNPMDTQYDSFESTSNMQCDSSKMTNEVDGDFKVETTTNMQYDSSKMTNEVDGDFKVESTSNAQDDSSESTNA